jgi:hypothetical protein
MVETREIEPLTPALQMPGLAVVDASTAGQADRWAVCGVPTVCNPVHLAAILIAIADIRASWLPPRTLRISHPGNTPELPATRRGFWATATPLRQGTPLRLPRIGAGSQSGVRHRPRGPAPSTGTDTGMAVESNRCPA